MCIMVHTEIAMDIAQTPSAQIRSIVAAALSESGMGQRRLEATRSLPVWSLRGIMDPSREQSPSVDRAADILAALGYELVIRPREAVSTGAAASEKTRQIAPIRRVFSERSNEAASPEPAPGAALEPVTDRHIAEAVAVLADEYDALNARGRESLLMRFWAVHPDLRERERRLARVVGWLGWQVVEGDARPAASKPHVKG